MTNAIAPNRVRFGAHLLGVPVPDASDREGFLAARLATAFSRELWKVDTGFWDFNGLVASACTEFAPRAPGFYAVAAKVLRRLKKRGHLGYDAKARYWFSRQREQRRERRAARRASRIENFVRQYIEEIMDFAPQDRRFRTWMLNACRYILGRELTLDESLRFAEIAQGRVAPDPYKERGLK